MPLDLPSSLDSMITLAIRTDNRLQEHKWNCNQTASSADRHWTHAASSTATWQSSSHFPPPVPQQKASSEEEEPMQLGQAKLSTEEHHCRLQEGWCFYFQQQGHLFAMCQAKGCADQ